MEEENFNWLETFIEIQNNKDVKLSNDFKILNSNNIDTNELTKHEPDKDAGTVELNYKDEKVKETDGYNYTKGALAFLRDMPEETVKSLMLAFLNGVDVTANASAVIFNAMVSVDPAMEAAFQNKDLAKFQKSFNANVQTFSKYLEGEKKQVKEIGETSGENSKGAEFVAMIVQDTPYALPIYKKFKSMGVPSYFALPLAYGMGSGIAFDDDATLFLNSEQVQSFKEMIKVLPNSSEEKIYNTTFRMLEGTSLGFLIPKVFQGLKFAKNTIPKYMTPQTSIAVGAAAATGAAVDKANSEEIQTFDPEVVKKLTNVIEGETIEAVIDGLANGVPDSELLKLLEGEFEPSDLDLIKKELGITKTTNQEKLIFDPEVVKKLTNVMEGYRIQDVIDGLANGLPDSELLGFLEGEFEPSDLNLIKKELGIKEPTTDAEIDKAYGEGASEKAMIKALKKPTNQDMQNTITAAEKADDQILFFNENDMTETKEDEPINAYITITDPQALARSDIVFYDDETMEQMTYNKVNENDDNWIILNKDRETTSYKQ